MATTYNITEHESGDTFYGVEFSLANQDGPIDLTDSVIELTTNRGQGLTTVDDGGITITDASGGVFQINEQIIDWPAEVYAYEIGVTYPSGIKRTYLKGSWTIV